MIQQSSLVICSKEILCEINIYEDILWNFIWDDKKFFGNSLGFYNWRSEYVKCSRTELESTKQYVWS